MDAQRIRWSPPVKITVSILLLIFIIYLLFRFSVVIPPFILALILAYILTPLVARLEDQLEISRGFASLIAYLILIIVALMLPLLLLPPLASQLAVLNVDIQLLLEQLNGLIGRQYNVLGLTLDGSQLVQQLTTSLQGLVEPFIGQTLTLLVDIISSTVWVIFILVVSFYLVKDGPEIRKRLERLPPKEYRADYIRLRDEINIIWSSFFRGQLTLALVVGVLLTLVGIILGLPFALAMGILAGFLEFLPSIGHAIWLTIASILALFVGSTWLPIPNWAFALLVIGLHIVFQQFDLNYLIPRVIGHSVHLPPLVIILGIVAGAVLAGILGIPLAAPTIASARVIGRYIYANLFDLDPFPPQPPAPTPAPRSRWWQIWRKVED